MSPLLLALTLSALPCGVLAEDQPCESSAGVPRGVHCWRNGGAGSGIGSYETKWVDLRTCTVGSLVLTTVKGWADASYSIPELPPGAKRNAKLQAAITAALVPPPEDPKNPRHAIAHLKRVELKNDTVTVLPQEPWWPGPVPKQANSSTTTDGPFDENGTCPCWIRFDGERFSKVREWKVGTQTLSMWAYLHVNRGELAFAVTDEGDKRHRWIHRHHNVGREPQAHVEGTRWYLPMTDGIGESFSLLGYDASTGEAWRLSVNEISGAHVTDGGVQLAPLEAKGPSPTRTWESLGPGK